jgi:phosphoribosyl 1,2-cyclic phosphodiesterase
MRLTFCGVRGSTPAPGGPYVRYGGHTSSVAISDGDAAPRLVIDAGTGIRAVTALLGGKPYTGTILLGHLHWDHTQGLPFFAGGGADDSRVDVRLPEQGVEAEQLLARCMGPPHFPVRPSELGAGWTFGSINEGAHVFDGYDVRALEIPHKGGRTFGYRVNEHGGRAIAYLSDHSPTTFGPGEHGHGVLHRPALRLAHHAAVLVHDAQQVAAELPSMAYLGHACAEYAVDLAVKAQVQTLVLFHHAPTRTDDEIDDIVARARAYAERLAPDLVVVAASEGLRIDV